MTMERYAKYKDSGVDWIGEIPEGWKTTAIRHVLQLHSGSALPDDQYDAEGDFPVYGGGAIRGRANQCNVQGQTVIVSRQGATCGTTRFIEGNAWITEHALIAYFLDVMYNKRYFAYVLHAMNLGNLSMTAAQPGISASIVQSQHTPVPNHIEQQAIADYLDEKTAAIEAAVADVERSIELLNEYRQSVISEAVTKGLNPNVPMKDSGIDWIGRIPEGWSICKTNLLFELIGSGTTPNTNDVTQYNGNVAWIQSGDLRQSEVATTKKTVTDKALSANSALIMYDAPFIIIAMYGASIGNSAVSLINACVNQACCVLKSSNNSINYYSYVFQSAKNALVDAGIGGTQPNISQALIRSFRVPVPSINEQRIIADYLSKKCDELDSLITQKQSLIVRLKEYRSSLISECVTGKVKVPGVKE